jgi:hypothetical protein
MGAKRSVGLARVCRGGAVARLELVGVVAVALGLSGAGCSESTQSKSSPSGSGSAGAFDDPTPWFTPAGATRACVLATACLRDAPNWSGGACVYAVERMQVFGTSSLTPFAKCAVNATSCTEALDCATAHHGPDYCATHASLSCDGDLSIACPAGEPTAWAYEVIDCKAEGMTCIDGGLCRDGHTCTGPIVLSCQDNRITACDLLTGTQASTDCATAYPGGTCGAFDADLECLPVLKERCTSAEPLLCVGNALVGCDGPRETRLDCGPLDSDCVSDDLGNVDCVPRADDCTHDAPDQCHGSALSICVDGRYQDIDCASLGLGPCAPSASGVACGAQVAP